MPMLKLVLFRCLFVLALMSPTPVGATDPLAPFLVPGLDLSGATELAGAVRGDVVVENGVAAYAVPVVVPPGTAGVEPTLAIAVQSPAANSIIGVGGGIAGLSAIQRCPTRHEPDGVVDPVDFGRCTRTSGAARTIAKIRNEREERNAQ